MFSVILVTYNRKLLLKECLNSLFNQNFGKEYEIIIIDNCSSDGTGEVIKKEYNKKVKLITNPTKLSLVACKNLGLKMSSGDMIAFIDDDCVTSNNWLEVIENSLDNYDSVGGPVLPMPTTRFPWWWNNSLNWLIGINLKPNNKYLPLGSNIAFKKSVLEVLQEDIKYIAIDHNQYLPYMEDNFRVKKALSLGFSMKIDPNMIVYHYIPQERFKLFYLVKRSYWEGCTWVDWERNVKSLILSFICLIINPVRLLISGNINRFFRLIVNVSYILNYIK